MNKVIFTIIFLYFLVIKLYSQNSILKDDGDITSPLPLGTSNSIITEQNGGVGINGTPSSVLEINSLDASTKNAIVDIYNGNRTSGSGHMTSGSTFIYPFQAPYLLKVGHSYSIFSPAPGTPIPITGIPIFGKTDFVIDQNGNVGINTLNPLTPLDVNANSTFRSSQYLLGNNFLNGNNEFNGTSEFNNHITVNNTGSLLFSTYRYVDLNNHVTNFRCLNTNFNKSTIPGAMLSNVNFNDVSVYFNANSTTYFNGYIPHMHIGSLKPIAPDDDAIFSVDGKMMAKRCKITIHSWADDVFKKDYKLMSLQDLKLYIQNHSHLPGVPTEKEVLKDGIDLGTMNEILLRKIEELTLYLIHLKTEIETLKLQVK